MIPYSLNPMGVNTDVVLNDLDILRQIRDANSTSQLSTLWRDDEDPHTQWDGVYWGEENTKVVGIYTQSVLGSTLYQINKLVNLISLDCAYNQISSLDVSGLTNLEWLYVYNNQLGSIDLTGTAALHTFLCVFNQLSSIPTLMAKGLITTYDFRHNNFPTAELDRFRAMGFTDESRLLPQNI